MVVKTTRGIKRLEIIMHDVLDGLEDAASYMNYHSVPDTIKILSIEPADKVNQSHPEIIQINSVTCPDKRKLKKSA